MAIIAPGIFLSQPPIARTPSRLCPLQTVSMESAITSLETREYFIPSVPMEIPSLMVIVPKSCGIPPANLVAASARIAKSLIPMLQGVMVLNPLAMPGPIRTALGTLGNNATSVVICHNFIFLQWRLMCAIAAQVLQSHLYFYFLTFGRSEQVLGQSISKENIKLWE